MYSNEVDTDLNVRIEKGTILRDIEMFFEFNKNNEDDPYGPRMGRYQKIRVYHETGFECNIHAFDAM